MVFDSDEELNDALNIPDSALSGEALSSETRPHSRRGHPTSPLTADPSPSGTQTTEAVNLPTKKRKMSSLKISAGKKDVTDTPSVSF